jgi:hypothetical protein
LPEANERVSHGEPTWFAGKGKVFAMLDNHHHGSEHLGVWLPQPRGVQERLLAAEPKQFFRPPYVGPSGWVGVVLDIRPGSAWRSWCESLTCSSPPPSCARCSPRGRPSPSSMPRRRPVLELSDSHAAPARPSTAWNGAVRRRLLDGAT